MTTITVLLVLLTILVGGFGLAFALATILEARRAQHTRLLERRNKIQQVEVRRRVHAVQREAREKERNERALVAAMRAFRGGRPSA